MLVPAAQPAELAQALIELNRVHFGKASIGGHCCKCFALELVTLSE